MAFRTDFEVDKGADKNSRLASMATPPMKFEGKGASNFRIIFLGHRDTKKRQLKVVMGQIGFSRSVSQLFTAFLKQKSQLMRNNLLLNKSRRNAETEIKSHNI